MGVLAVKETTYLSTTQLRVYITGDSIIFKTNFSPLECMKELYKWWITCTKSKNVMFVFCLKQNKVIFQNVSA